MKIRIEDVKQVFLKVCSLYSQSESLQKVFYLCNFDLLSVWFKKLHWFETPDSIVI
jgi:hypothetical protein